MYNCHRCGKPFPNVRALGGHRGYCNGSKGLMVRGSDQREVREVRGSEVRNLASTSVPLPSLQFSSVQSLADSPVLQEATKVARGYQQSGLPFQTRNIGRKLVAIAIGVVVTWLIYRALEHWEWKGTSKKQINPYNLIGGLIKGLG